MASGPYWSEKRGTWTIQYNDGYRWHRITVVRKRPGWKVGDPPPRKVPPAAVALLAEYQRKEAEAKIRRPADPQRTVRGFLEGFHAGCGNSRSKGSAVEIGKAVKVFLAWCDEKSITHLNQVTSAVCHRWMDDRSKTIAKVSKNPITHATMKKERALLARAWTEAIKREELLVNPWLTVDVPGKPNRKKREAWTPEQLSRLLAASKTWLRDVITIGCTTGLRIGALRMLEWRDIKWNEKMTNAGPSFGIIEVRPELDKAGKGYNVPIYQQCHDVLVRRKIQKDEDATFVLTGHQGRPIRGTFITATAITRACKSAGLDKPSSPNHHMRRTFGRHAVLGHLTGQAIPIYVVSKWLGHSSIKMTEHYLDMEQDDSAQWMVDVREGGWLSAPPAQGDGLRQASLGQKPDST